MKVILFGLGNYYGRFRKFFRDDDIIALCDNNTKKQGEILDGKLVVPPEQLKTIYFDKIYILSSFVKEIKKQLFDLGITEEKVEVFFDILIPTDCVQRYDGLPCKKKSQEILVIASDMNNTSGATIVLFQMVKLITNMGYRVTVASPVVGPFIEDFLGVCHELVVDPRLLVGRLSDIEWVGKYGITIVNTVHLYYLFRELPKRMKVLWWIHEAAELYSSVDYEILNSINWMNIYTYAVSNVARKPFLELTEKVKCGIMPYGKQDIPNSGISYNTSHIVRFVVVGSVEYRKGQDILVKAAEKVLDHGYTNFEIDLIGNYGNQYSDELLLQIEQARLPIRLLGPIGNMDLLKKLEEYHVLICCSRQDPLPVVVTEAMMKNIPSIMSNSIGTCDYIEDNQNSLVFDNENSDELCEKIIWCICHRDSLKEMGRNARRVYEEFFSLEAFEERIKKNFLNS